MSSWDNEKETICTSPNIIIKTTNEPTADLLPDKWILESKMIFLKKL